MRSWSSVKHVSFVMLPKEKVDKGIVVGMALRGPYVKR